MPSDIAPYSVIYINSSNAVQPYNGESGFFTMNLAGFPFESVPGKTVKMGLMQATMIAPYTNVNSTNNELTLNEELATVESSVTIIIPVGVYTLASLATALATALNANSPNSVTYTVTGNTMTNVYTFTSNSATVTTFFGFDLAGGSSSLLGFPGVLFSGNFITGTPLVAPSPANLSDFIGPQSLIVRCNQITSRVYDSRTGSVGNIFAVIPNTVTTAQPTLTYIPAVPRIFGNASQVLTQLTFAITDTNGNVVPGLTSPIEFVIGVYHFDDY